MRSEFPPRHDLLTDWNKLPETVRQFNRDDARTLPALLAKFGWEVRRQEKIVAADEGLGGALAQLTSGEQSRRERLVVIADIDTAEGRNVAERTLDLPDVRLWLLSSNAPAPNQDLQKIAVAATGWVSRRQFCRSRTAQAQG
jgi:hypothetical protein